MNWTIYCIECVAVFVGLALLTGAKDFKTAFLASYGLWFVVDWYDCFFLDWVLFANVKRIRLPGTEQMDQAYHQKKYHVIRSLIGMALEVVPMPYMRLDRCGDFVTQ